MKSKKLEFEEMYIMHLKSLFTMHAEHLKKSEESQDESQVTYIKGVIAGIEMAVDGFNFIYELQRSKDGTTEPITPDYDSDKVLVIKRKS